MKKLCILFLFGSFAWESFRVEKQISYVEAWLNLVVHELLVLFQNRICIQVMLCLPFSFCVYSIMAREAIL